MMKLTDPVAPPPPPPDRYVRHISICLAMDALPFALLLLMLINASSMFEFHMLLVAAIMFYILELIMEIVPNFPTVYYRYRRYLRV